MGIQQADRGTITIDNRRFTTLNQGEALAAGVAYVPQCINMMTALTVAENIMAGSMPVNRLGFVQWRTVYREAEERLAQRSPPR